MTPPARAALWGRDQQKLGEVGGATGTRCAVALSAGGAKKTYAHVDPNEDAAAFAEGAYGLLVAVADGHGGCEASELALRELLARYAADWTEAPRLPEANWEETVCRALGDLNDAVLRNATGSGHPCRTTLALALARPAEGRWLCASLGDSHVFEITSAGARDLTLSDFAIESTPFLGSRRWDQPALQARCFLSERPLTGTLAVALATDGLSEFSVGVEDPEACVAEAFHSGCDASETPAAATAHIIVNHACEAHRHNPSGDNVAAAVIWLVDIGV